MRRASWKRPFPGQDTGGAVPAQGEGGFKRGPLAPVGLGDGEGLAVGVGVGGGVGVGVGFGVGVGVGATTWPSGGVSGGR